MVQNWNRTMMVDDLVHLKEINNYLKISNSKTNKNCSTNTHQLHNWKENTQILEMSLHMNGQEKIRNRICEVYWIGPTRTNIKKFFLLFGLT